MRRPDGWGQFLFLAHPLARGPRRPSAPIASSATLALAAPAKLNLLARLLDRHNGDRVI